MRPFPGEWGFWWRRCILGAGLVLASTSAGCSREKAPPSEQVSTRSERLEVTDGLVAAYDFDDGSGTTAADVSGTGNTGTLSGPSWVTAGRRGSALSFDGIDDRVIVPDSASLDLTMGMTLMAWVRPTTTESDWWTVVLKERDSEGLVYSLYAAEPDGPPNAWLRTGGVDEMAFGNHHPPRTDRWTHLAATYDGSTFSFYANGRLTSSTAVSGAIETSSDVLSIGGNAVWGEWFQGLIDEVRVYNRGLSQSEVVLEMGGISPGPAPVLVAGYNFDEGSGSVAADSSSSSNAGTLSGPTWSAAGKHGGALSFDGTDDRVVVADSPSLDLTYGMTLMAWVNPVSIDDNWRTVALKERDASTLAYALYASDNGGQPPAGYFDHDGLDYGITAASPLALDTWSHLAVSYNDITFAFYVNGELAGTRNIDGDIQTSSDALSIGGNAVWGEWFEGLIDDVRIYDNGLTQAQIVADMNTPVGSGGGCGSGCDDGNPCNGIETCVNASCVAGTPVTCTASDQCHDAGTCNPSTGACSNPPKANGAACSDTNACTQTDTCQSGTCTGANPIICAASDQCHVSGTCDPANGACSNPAKPNGAACNDNSACTQTDTCQSGACTGGNPVVCVASDQCHDPGTCNPANGTCSNPAKPNGSTCSDGNACTQTDTCQTGACTGANPVVCVASDSCHDAGTCSPSTGTCSNPVKPDGSACSDATVCNGPETCQSGTCTPGTPPATDDSNPCTADACDPTTGVSHTPVATGTTCSDFDQCNGSELCDGAGVCQPGTPVSTEDGNECTAGGCDPATGVVTQAPLPTGTECFIDVCTLAECNPVGECTAAGSTVTDDGDPCTIEWCDPGLGPQVKQCSALDRTVGTTLHESMKWIYEQPNPPQVGVAPGTIEVKRAAALRGIVNARDGSPLPGVKVTILDHPEFGYTLSHADGYFDMVVNGGGDLVVALEKENLITVHRPISTVWGEHATVAELVMIPPDPIVTSIDLAAPAEEFQVAQGSVQSDVDGSRQGTLLVPAGTEATMELDDGTTVDLSSMSVRLTEFTVGETGPNAMPAPLPPDSKYTYAFEASIDEAVAAGAESVTFSMPLPYYVDNFLDFPAGTVIPLGFLDRKTSTWKADESGVTLEIVAESAGLAALDVTGDGVEDIGAELAFYGITDSEREKLAELYEPGQSLWRVLIRHFTPWDCNLGGRPPDDAEPPPNPPPDRDRKSDCDSEVPGASTIQCESQVLRESIAIAGTPYALNYSSQRVLGRKAAFRMEIPLSGDSVPASLVRIDLEVSVAGRVFREQFAPSPNQTKEFVWDGVDAFGRRPQGAQVFSSNVSYVYEFHYTNDCCGRNKFGHTGNGLVITVNDARTELYFPQEAKEPIGIFDATALGLGGWTIDGNHFHELVMERLQLGEGATLDRESLPSVAKVATTGPVGFSNRIAVGPDGSLYSGIGGAVWRTPPGGATVVFAGTPGQLGYGGDGLPATDPAVSLNGFQDLALGRDGSLFIADTGNQIVRRVRPDGVIETVAGVPGVLSLDPGNDNLPATSVPLWNPSHIALGTDGSLYVTAFGIIRRISPEGTINTHAGNAGSDGLVLLPDDDTVAVQTQLEPGAMAVAPDGTLHVALTTCTPPNGPCANNRIVRIVDGRIYLVAGIACASAECEQGPAAQDGLPAKESHIRPSALAFDSTGQLYFMESFGRVRTITPDGLVTTVASRSPGGSPFVEGAPATAVSLSPRDIAFGPDGLYVGGGTVASQNIFRIAPPLPSNSGASFFVGARSEDAFYSFDSLGRHLVTRHSLTGSNLRSFSYVAGRLDTVTDESGLVTYVERDASGSPTAIVAPFGQRTELTLDPNGYLATATDPEGHTTTMTYTTDGLLTSLENARGHTSTMSYDPLGRLELDENPVGGSHTLVRTNTEDPTEWSIARTTALGRTTSYDTSQLTTGEEVRTIVDPSGNTSTVTSTPDKVVVAALPDGTLVTTSERPDARFGLNAPLFSRTTLTPSGLTSTESSSRTYTGLNPSNVLDFFERQDTTTRNGRNWRTVFEQSTRTFTTTSPQGRQTLRVIDPQARTTRTQVAGLLPVDFFYDPSGRLDHVTQGTRTTQNAYFPTGAAAGYLSGITDATSIATTFTRDALGRTLTETRASATTSFSWDPLNNLSSVTPPGKPVHDMNYTPVNLLESYEPPPAGLPASATGYTYDLDRMLRTETRPGGVSIVRTPDSAGRLDTVAIPGGLVDYDYFPSSAPSGADKVSDIRGPYGVDLAFTYDGSLTTSTTWSGDVVGSVAWQYNNDFLKILETVNGATGTAQTALGYDNDLLLACASPTTCSPPGADALTLTRHPQHGMVTNISLGETSETWSYDDFGELARQTATFDGSPLVDIAYEEAGFERDALGRIVRKTETILGVTKVYEYRYDALRRLDQVKIDGVVDEEFTYDANGNRLAAFKQGVGTVTATYDDQDRLLTYGTWTFTYTANGELETKTNTATNEEWMFRYDALGNLVSVGLPNGDLVEYLADGMGRRVGKKVNGMLVRQWVYRDLLKPVAELDGNGNLLSAFAYASKSLVPDYVTRGQSIYRVFSDYLGSPRYAVNVANVADVPFQATYSAFGEPLGVGFDWLPFGFVGGQFDTSTGLVRFGARDYDATVGRWTIKDPIQHAGGNNLYAYSMNNPVMLRDPWGLDPSACMISPLGCNDPVLKGMQAGLESIIDWFTAATISMCGESEREKNCEAMYENDLDSCRAMGRRNKSRAARCYAAAMERRIACKQGRPLPPLHGWN